MDPITVSALITAGIPFVTAGLKRLITRKLVTPEKQPGINTLIPLVLGILSTGLYTYSQTHDVVLSIAAGLGSGSAAASMRDVDKNLTGIVESIYKLASKKKGP